MPGELFLDTSAWFPALASWHPLHSSLAAILSQAVGEGGRPVTSNLVVAETHALLLRRSGRKAAVGFLREVSAPLIVVVSSTPELEGRALREWIERYDDQDFSLADAVSFAVMDERGIEEALTLDHHFRVAGFRTRPARNGLHQSRRPG